MTSLGFPGGSYGKASEAMLETHVQSLGWEDPLEKDSCLENFDGQRSLVGDSPWGHKEWEMAELLRPTNSNREILEVSGMMQETQCWCSVPTWRGGDGREVEGGFRMEYHRYACGQFMLMYGRSYHNIKVIILQLNYINNLF